MAREGAQGRSPGGRALVQAVVAEEGGSGLLHVCC